MSSPITFIRNPWILNRTLCILRNFLSSFSEAYNLRYTRCHFAKFETMLFFNKFNVINKFCKITKHLLYFGRTEVIQLYVK